MSGGEPSSIKRFVLCAADNLYLRMTERTLARFWLEEANSLYRALYRAYRPRTFDDVVGQGHITQTLKNEIALGRVSHAYLFTGSRGTGKTTCSKIIAKAVNCPHQKEGNPCGVCDICRGIDEGSILDVSEIDAASNNGVDNIRQLREEAYFTPSVVRYRVYIIDEAHMLSTGAFNALLKIMEEPPEHVLFILATTEIQKVPATILSRCQRFDFRRIPSGVIAARLLEIAAKEEIGLEDSAAQLIARLADGGMRDALSLLDLCASATDTVSAAVVMEVAGVAVNDRLFAIADCVLRQDASGALQTVEQLAAEGADYGIVCGQLISHYRNLMICRSVKEAGELIACLPEELTRYREQAAGYRMGEILAALSVLQEAAGRMGRSTHKRTELEMTLVRLCTPSLEANPQAILARLERLEDGLRGVQTSPLSAQTTRAEAVPSPVSAVPPAAVQAEPIRSQELSPPEPPAWQADTRPASPPANTGEAIPFAQWAEVLSRLEKKNQPLHGALRASEAYLQGNRVLIRSENEFFLKLVRENQKAKTDLKESIAQVTGRAMAIGPYRPGGAEPKRSDPLEDILQDMTSMGIPVEIE